VVLDIEAPDGSGLIGAGMVDWPITGRVPDVEGVGKECGELEEEGPLELGSEGGCCTCLGCCCAGTGASTSAAGVVIVHPSG
jgi:hypothetical protein